MTLRPESTVVLSEVYNERLRQVLRWGEQIVPDIAPGDDGTPLFPETYARYANRIRAVNDARPPERRDMLTLLLEEVFEAAEARAAGDVSAYRAEMVQVAALAVKAIELVDLRLSQDPGLPGYGEIHGEGR